MTVRTRFAPSPTGFLHIGGARTALYCWLEARHRGGQFILRVEDTDRTRSTDEAVQAILDGMAWLGLDHDEGPIYQTDRGDRYRAVAHSLVEAGKAYYCTCTRERLDTLRQASLDEGRKPRYDGHCRGRRHLEAGETAVIRFQNPDHGSVAFDDRIKGRIEWANEELDDLVILRSDGWPTYNFAVVVDDSDMRISEVIRGDDHVNNTPRQINIYHALGLEPPAFAHLPMILGGDGQKLSKRHGAVGVMQYRDDGYLPHALLNYLVRLGWSHGDQEIFSNQEMVELFDVANVNSAPARFDFAKLDWLNQHYLKTNNPAAIAPQLGWHLRALGIDPDSGPAPADVVVALRERVHTLKEMAERARIWYAPVEHWDSAAVRKHLGAATAPAALAAARKAFATLPDWSPEAIHEAIKLVSAELEVGMGKVAQPLRVAMTGTQVSPSIEHTVFLAGRDGALQRIDTAIERSAGAHAGEA
ncbi:MAG TPA: glutamate--tRNA ligase [Rhodanobacteraceae bacterium]|nr:glutamate--tRNA ligase [Rhodanobacteraceae bacterium]